MFSEFKKFILKGDVVALATGVIIGAAFGEIVKAFTKGFVEPLISFISGGGVDVRFTVEPVEGLVLDIGMIITAIIGFLITALIIFFFIVKPSQALMKRMLEEEKKAPPAPAADVVLLEGILEELKKRKV